MLHTSVIVGCGHAAVTAADTGDSGMVPANSPLIAGLTNRSMDRSLHTYNQITFVECDIACGPVILSWLPAGRIRCVGKARQRSTPGQHIVHKATHTMQPIPTTGSELESAGSVVVRIVRRY